jgi:2-oxo-4-hydroxy-4-carboxy-5-ureidoimidazoline decarboxylase
MPNRCIFHKRILPPMTIDELNRLNETKACEAFEQCCGASRWVDRMVVGRPYEDLNEMLTICNTVWEECDVEDYMEAFSHHPRVYAAGPQLRDGSGATLEDLADAHEHYESRFGHVFIVSAQGKSLAELLELMKQRLVNTPEQELLIAAAEQNKITHMRLKKLLHTGAGTPVKG